MLQSVPKQSYITLSYCGEVSRGEMDKRTEKRAGFSVLCSAPGMGNNWVVKDHYALGSRKR